MASSFIAYVDESGDEGFSFPASSEWFVLSALVLRRQTELEAVKVLDGVKAMLRKEPRRPLHFRKLEHHQRVAYVSELARLKSRMRTVSIMVHKPSLIQVGTFTEKYLLYRYAARFLLERVSWLCRDHRRADDGGDGTVEVVFSNRKNMSYDDLRTYLDVLRDLPGSGIDWSVLKRDQVHSLPHDQRRGLQIVDAVASSYWYGLNPNQYGQTEDRYARIIHPLAYARGGNYKAYGLKFFPADVEKLLAAEGRFEWVRQLRGGFAGRR
ncbi:MAG TPA: DUF3800 domain-containing protein [Longimicrobium sp.]|nr:DUF3800 domain-containing protein [Longimicrobium sp.]